MIVIILARKFKFNRKAWRNSSFMYFLSASNMVYLTIWSIFCSDQIWALASCLSGYGGPGWVHFQKKKLGHTCWTFNDFEEKWLTSDHPIMNLPFAIASSKNDCYFRHMCVCLSVAMKRWQQRFAKNERCAIKIIVEKLMFFLFILYLGFLRYWEQQISIGSCMF